MNNLIIDKEFEKLPKNVQGRMIREADSVTYKEITIDAEVKEWLAYTEATLELYGQISSIDPQPE